MESTTEDTEESLRGSADCVQLLQCLNADVLSLSLRSQRFDQRLRAGHGRHTSHVHLQCGAANGLFVVMRSSTQRRVDYQGDVTLLNMVSDVWAAFIHF